MAAKSSPTPFVNRQELLPLLAETVNCQPIESWLLRAPPITTIRVNLLKSSVDRVKQLIRDAWTKQYGENTPKFISHPDFPELVGIAPLSSTNVGEQNENGPEIREIIVDVSCGASVLRGAHVFAPGVLGMAKHSREGDLAHVFADLEGKCKKGADSYQSMVKMFLGTGRIIQPRYKLFSNAISPTGIAVQMSATVSGVPCLGDSYLSPSIGILQNLPSMAAVRALDPHPGEIVLDMCASPGNKTTHIVELMNDTGTVIALDKTPQKLKPIQQKIEQYRSLKCFAQDSTKCIHKDSGNDQLNGPPPFPPESFDRVLLDAPCSALGNRPQLSNRITAKMLQSFPVQQKQLFFAAVEALKIGGILVYSTCSINQSENESIIEWALRKFPQLELVPITLRIGGPAWPTEGLTEEQLHKMRRFGPPTAELSHPLEDSVGFFMAKLRKNSQ